MANFNAYTVQASVGATAVFSAAQYSEQTQIDFGAESNNSPAQMSLFVVNTTPQSDSVSSISPFPIYLVIQPITGTTQGTISIVGTALTDVGCQVSGQNPSLIPAYNAVGAGGSPGAQSICTINIFGTVNTWINRGWV